MSAPDPHGGDGRPVPDGFDAPPVPGGFGDLTADWMEAALRAGPVPGGGGIGPDVTVASVAVAPLGPHVGFLGDLARVTITYTRGSGPASVIVKLPTTDPGGHQVGSMLRAWAREVAFYREVAPASPGARVPRCWHTGADAAAGRWVVVLEDLGPGAGGGGTAGATGPQVSAAVNALAELHATWWGSSPPRFAWMPGFDVAGVGGLAPAWAEAHPRFLARYGHVVPDPTGDWLLRLAEWLGPWSDRVAAGPLTVVHADYRLDNLLFTSADAVPTPAPTFRPARRATRCRRPRPP